MSESRLSYADALRARVHDTRDDMIALGPTRPQTNEPNDTNVALVSTNILILFSSWQREKMKGEKRLREGHMSAWDDAWLPSVPQTHEVNSTPQFDPSLPRTRKAPDWYR